MKYKACIFLAGILCLGAFFRFYLITEIPPGLYPDEATNGNNAVEAIEHMRNSKPWEGFRVFYPENNGREGLFINLQALAILALGAKPWVLRMVSGMFGTLTILGLYLLTRELFHSLAQSGTAVASAALDQRAGTVPEQSEDERGGRVNSKSSLGILNVLGGAVVPLLSSFFLATSYWHINFSRIGFRAIMVPFFTTFGIYWLLKALRTGKISSTILAGIFIGFGFHTYIAFRFVPFIIAIPILWHLWQWWKEGQRSKVKSQNHNSKSKTCVPCVVMLFLLTTLVVALPMGYYFLQHPEDFLGRSGQVSIFSAEKPFSEFLKSTALTLQMFFWQGDCNQRHNFACQPEINLIVAFFFVCGFLLTLLSLFKTTDNDKFQIPHVEVNPNSQTPRRHWKLGNLLEIRNLKLELFKNRLAPILLFTWLFFMMFPATLTRENLPHALRAIGMIPPVMIFAGLGASALWSMVTVYLANVNIEEQHKRYRRQIARMKKEVTALALLLLAFIAFTSFRTYFLRFPESVATFDAFSGDLEYAGEYIAALPKETRKFVVVPKTEVVIRGLPAPAQTPMFISDTFSQEKRAQKNVQYVLSADEINFAPNAKIAIILLDGLDKVLRENIRKKFPELRQKNNTFFLSFEN